jgi:hypothetical protein
MEQQVQQTPAAAAVRVVIQHQQAVLAAQA